MSGVEESSEKKCQDCDLFDLDGNCNCYIKKFFYRHIFNNRAQPLEQDLPGEPALVCVLP